KTHFEDCRILMSGTPVRNYAGEIFPIANMLDPFKFRNYKEFRDKYLDYTGKALYNPAQFHADFAPYYLRRTTAEVLTMLPAIRNTKLYTQITDEALAKAYNRQLDVMTNLTRNGERLDTMSLLGYLQRLRHITGIAKSREPAILEPIKDYLREGGPDGAPAKVLIGLHHHFVADSLAQAFKEFRVFSIRGGMDDIKKEQVKQEFIMCDAPALCLLSIKAAGEGIDGLQASCCRAYVFERQWNGADELQFAKRLHRPGQQNVVTVEYTMGVGTIDEFYDDLVEYKRHITTQVEDENYESNPAFLRELADRVIAAGHLPTSYQNVDELVEVA
ncbi:MAG: DEAD/DEAH box helicase, partial [Aliidongia sp.]